mmetsp:Transcript_14608/g.24319  ORF Transcript_14608/g.24319 Transcript_14608/m.24319 type:complete len:330 (-) Transcript_14608:85-1074(-)|eukprot:CAMPEP_0119310378 /NCGR_PEP_ID=MMETSP1333-20130426/19099_1 /TAXON_ID=418940 /ORGANISM="Scyphosphaera apsteinii, Strain RCC1455" /LENGTH=329 /DNA_ID=CAMNT_0007314553 /DNA_START=110 /DNA_END=1099 /DNA_ORIENTATION=+
MARVHEQVELTVSVVGCGRMGCAIAGEFVRRGCIVHVYDHTEYTRNRALQTVRAFLYDHVANGYLLKQDVEELIGRIVLVHSLEEALEKSEIVVESVFEDLQIKKDLFNQMGEICKQRAVPPDQVLLCSNTMNLFMGSITEDVCKEYRGSCIGMRFLHPVWFIDEVELTDCDYTRRNTCAVSEKLLKQLFFQPFFYDGCYRRRLTLQEIATYQSRQRLRCPEPIKTLLKRGVRKKLGSSPDKHASGTAEIPAGSAGSASADKDEAAGSVEVEETEPCAVCLEEPRCALLVPCGHVAMCVECAEKVLQSNRAVCVVCRQPIEKILRAAPP